MDPFWRTSADDGGPQRMRRKLRRPRPKWMIHSDIGNSWGRTPGPLDANKAHGRTLAPIGPVVPGQPHGVATYSAHLTAPGSGCPLPVCSHVLLPRVAGHERSDSAPLVLLTPGWVSGSQISPEKGR